MEAAEIYRDFVLSAVVADTPQGFWRTLGEKTQFIYGEAFSAVAADTALLDEQREQKLYQERYFKLEYGLVAAAKENGVAASAKLIGTNRCYYAYAARGRVGMTQSYVKNSGEMPSPAAFRKQLAEMAEFRRIYRLDLGDESTELVTPKQVSGIILHSPVGNRFTEAEQKLSAMDFCIAYDDYSGWAVRLALAEIVAAYTPIETREDRVIPARKKIQKTGTEE